MVSHARDFLPDLCPTLYLLGNARKGVFKIINLEGSITVKRIQDGRISNYINDHVVAGSKLTLLNVPQSTPDFLLSEIPSKVLFLEGGVGITPILSMLRKYQGEHKSSDATLLYFNRNEQSNLFESELRQLAREAGAKVHFICSVVISSPVQGVIQRRHHPMVM